jgi:transposase
MRVIALVEGIITHSAANCHDCGQSLDQVARQQRDDRRQVFDLPPLKLEMTEHCLPEQLCLSCGTLNCEEFHAAVAPGVQYGSNIKSLAVSFSSCRDSR